MHVLLHTLALLCRVLATAACLVLAAWLLVLGTRKYTEVGLHMFTRQLNQGGAVMCCVGCECTKAGLWQEASCVCACVCACAVAFSCVLHKLCVVARTTIHRRGLAAAIEAQIGRACRVE